MTDDHLFTGIKNGNRRAEAAFYKLHYRMIEKMVLANNGSPEDAKDIYQETIMTVFSRIKNGELDCRTASLKTFLFAVANNKWKYHLREVKKIPVTSLGDEYQIIFPDEKECSIEQEERYRKAAIALEMIDDLCVRIIKAFYLDKMNMKKMAAEFGYKDENGMKKRKSLCMKAARQNLILINRKKYEGLF